MLALLHRDFTLHKKKWLLMALILSLFPFIDAIGRQTLLFANYTALVMLANSLYADSQARFLRFVSITPIAPRQYVMSKAVPSWGICLFLAAEILVIHRFRYGLLTAEAGMLSFAILVSGLWTVTIALPVLIRFGRNHFQALLLSGLALLFLMLRSLRYIPDDLRQSLFGLADHPVFIPAVIALTIAAALASVRIGMECLPYEIER